MTDFTYIKKLFGIEKSDGFSAEEMQNLLKMSPIVPKVLSDYYTELGKITPLNATQDVLLSPDKVEWLKNGDHLIFYAENQWTCVWAIQKTDLPNDNPPVYMSYDQEAWAKENQTLSDFFNAMATLQAVLLCLFRPRIFCLSVARSLSSLSNIFRKSPMIFRSGWERDSTETLIMR
ncbi:hypothetical protein [Capnocytophaga sp.]|uniref:hypothetical protein n=1 Tax=Capnocytophaga sp. TaxID=44737 RepID=UPI0026DD07D0|nr:hypothetical protein [Capnocytophaga sp.]MDO5105625.1 hypothetical protein [Capnocytophaga sp.]